MSNDNRESWCDAESCHCNNHRVNSGMVDSKSAGKKYCIVEYSFTEKWERCPFPSLKKEIVLPDEQIDHGY